MRRPSLYTWPFQLLMELWEYLTLSRQDNRSREEKLRRLNEREDRGLPPDEPWEKWR